MTPLITEEVCSSAAVEVRLSRRVSAGPSPGSGLPEPETWRGATETNRTLGALTLQLLRDWDGWIHRRVESISLEHPVTFTRRVSVDFTLYRGWPTTTFTA